MPLTPVDYSKTIIYKLVKNDDYDNSIIIKYFVLFMSL